MARWKDVTLWIGLISIAGAAMAATRPAYDFKAVRAAARAEGIPTRMSEIRWRSVPPEQAAAPDYERAWALQTDKDFTEPELDLMDRLTSPKGITDAEAVTLRKAFDAHADLLAALHAAAAKPAYAFPKPLADPSLELERAGPIFARLRWVAKTLRYESALLLREGHPLEAARTQSLGLNLGKQLSAYPTIISLLVRIALDGIAQAGLKDILLNAGANPEVARTVHEAAAKCLAAPDIRSAILGEAAYCGGLVDTFRAQTPNVMKGTTPKQRAALVAGQTASLLWTVRMARAASAPQPVRRKRMQAVVAELSKTRPHDPALESAEQSIYLYPMVLDHCDLTAARFRVLYVAASVLEYHARTGAYPAALSDAVSPAPVDPFDQKPLAYRRTAKGFEIEPVASSKRWAARTSARRKRDLVFAYPKP